MENISIRKLEKDDWQLFRAMRIEAVKAHPNFFLSNEKMAKERPNKEWKEFFADDNQCAIFGLFNKSDMIGLTGVFRSKESSDDTVNLGMSYIRPEYRGHGLSGLFYEARIDWAKSQKGIKRIVVGHREGNSASEDAIKKYGFKYFKTGEITFGDGSKGNDLYYELIL